MHCSTLVQGGLDACTSMHDPSALSWHPTALYNATCKMKINQAFLCFITNVLFCYRYIPPLDVKLLSQQTKRRDLPATQMSKEQTVATSTCTAQDSDTPAHACEASRVSVCRPLKRKRQNSSSDPDDIIDLTQDSPQ